MVKDEDSSQWLWVPLASAISVAVPGIIAVATHRVLLFASLGATAITIAQQPTHPSSRPYNVLVAHAVGFAVAAGFVFAFGLAHLPSVFIVHEVSSSRVAASVLAIAVAALLELALGAKHPPAGSTTLLVTLGSFHPTWDDALLVIGGVILVTVVGESLRRWRLRTS